MTVPAPRRTRTRLPRVQVAVLAGRARADRWPLAIAVLVVALTTFLAVAGPREVARAGDALVRDQLREAGSIADTTLVVPFPLTSTPSGEPETDSAAGTVRVALETQAMLAPELASRLQAPRASVVTAPLPAALPPEADRGEVTVQLGWFWDGEPPPVRWVAGGAPGAAPAPMEPAVGTPPPRQVPVALSAPVAARLHVGVGDTVPATNRRQEVELLVSGVFEPERPADPAWRAVRGLLEPLTTTADSGVRTETGALLSDESLPAARLAVGEQDVTRTLVFAPAADRLRAADVAEVARAVTAVATQPQLLAAESTPIVSSGLATVLLQARERLRAAQTQVSTLLTGVVGAAGLVLLVTAGLLARRRRPVLGLLRARGASLPGTALELLVESAAVALVGGGLGLLAADVVVPGDTPWAWLLAGPAVAAAAGPVLGVAAAAGTAGARRPAADREQRRAVLRDVRLRRVAAEGALVLVATGALAALRARSGNADLLVAAAPVLALLTGGVVLVRLLPALLGLVRGRASRSRHAVPLLAAVRASAGARVPLPVLALTVATGLCAFSLTLATTVERGQVLASWDAVGGDAAAVGQPSPRSDERAAAVAGRPGVERALAGRVEDRVPLLGVPGTERTTVVVVDPATFAGLLRSTPLPDVPDLDLLAEDGGTVDAGVHALLPAGAVAAGSHPSLIWRREELPLVPVGTVPPLLGRANATVVVDAGTLAAAAPGTAAVELSTPNTVWAVGPGALAAISDTPALATALVTDRRELLAERQDEALGRDLIRLMTAAAAAVLLFALLGVVLGTAGSAPERARTLAVLRTLGLTSGQVRRVIAGELLPPVLLPALVGSALGVGVAALTTGALRLQQLTGSADPPRATTSWLLVAAPGALLLLALVLIGDEGARRRRDSLGDVLRIGG
jgi:putative ABC transport system permease protein